MFIKEIKISKIIITILLVFLSIPTLAEDCKDGKIVVSHKASDDGCTEDTCNEYTFCVSNRPMYWWQGYKWCEEQGRKLANFKVMCPGIEASQKAKFCPNLRSVSEITWCWSAWSSSGSNLALYVDLSSGKVATTTVRPTASSRYSSHIGKYHESLYYVLCE